MAKVTMTREQFDRIYYRVWGVVQEPLPEGKSLIYERGVVKERSASYTDAVQKALEDEMADGG